jgi:hypothetical protein
MLNHIAVPCRAYRRLLASSISSLFTVRWPLRVYVVVFVRASLLIPIIVPAFLSAAQDLKQRIGDVTIVA